MAVFSIVVPVHRRYGLLRRALASVVAQTFEDWECWVVDDGSVPSVARAVPKDERFRLLCQGHGGASKARNNGLQHATGEWVAFLDSDDEWAPKKLEEHWRFIGRNPNLRAHQTEEHWVFRGRRRPIPKHLQKQEGDLFLPSLRRCVITMSSVVLHRSVVEKVGLFDEGLPSCEDFDYWLRLTNEYEVGLVRKPLATRYQGHRDQLSFRYEAMDRFRIRSLLSLHKGLKDAEKRRLVRDEIVRKATILVNGSMKRRRWFRALWYSLVKILYRD